MKRILRIGMDVHSTNYTLCAMEPVIGENDRIFVNIQVTPDYKNILMFIENLKQKLGVDNEYDIQCGYEAGCLGYSLYNQLTAVGVKCVILAPTTMLTQQGQRVKTDTRDALMIAQCLAYGGYHAVYIPAEEDDSVKEYLRMRDDHKLALKKIKQQINAFCLRHGYHFPNTKWTIAHWKWLKNLELKDMYRESLNEYMASYEEQEAKIERFDQRIEELASQEAYQEKVKKLECFLGIKTHTALSLIVETGDFERFAKGNTYAAFLGLAPGECSSGEKINRTGITKAGNSHLRLLLIESAGGICKGAIGHKSKSLRARQNGNTAEVIAYADKANARLRSRYYKFIRHGKARNVAVAAVARELACFVWGMMTDNISLKAA
ncbi:MAG TPA: IS110 family transposase [Lachnospiraceae bacterium]|nr:IS110 family transposase [Lachnospiraceae bacterium]